MELLIILSICLLMFGASRLPEIGQGLGSGMREFKTNLMGRGDDEDTKPKKELHS
jgi:sec-independent protein translocase protein TatA